MVIGRRLAKTLRVELGAEVVVLSQAADGSMANELYEVRGVLGPVNEVVDRGGVFMPRDAFLELFALDGGAHEIAVMSPTGTELEVAKAEVAAVAGAEETLTWRELQPVLSDMLNTSLLGQAFMMGVIYLAIAMVILNATLMSVFERIREFGVMKALGVTPFQVATIVFVETTVQAALAGAGALVVGLPLTLYFETHGIDLSAFLMDVSMMGVAFDPIWYTEAVDVHLGRTRPGADRGGVPVGALSGDQGGGHPARRRDPPPLGGSACSIEWPGEISGGGSGARRSR